MNELDVFIVKSVDDSMEIDAVPTGRTLAPIDDEIEIVAQPERDRLISSRSVIEIDHSEIIVSEEQQQK